MAVIGAGCVNRVGVVFRLCTAWMRAFVFRMVSINRIFLRFNMIFGFQFEGGGPRHLLAALFLLAMGRTAEKSEDYLPLPQSAWSGTGVRILLRQKV